MHRYCEKATKQNKATRETEDNFINANTKKDSKRTNIK